MKRLVKIGAVSILMAMVACQPVEDTLSEADKAEIAAEVLDVFNTMVEGMNEHDADKILSCYRDSDPFRQVMDGSVVTDWSAFENGVRTGHSDPDVYWPVWVNDIFVDVLNREFVMVTGRGESEHLDAAGDTLRTLYSVTDVFQATDDGWKIINEHESGFMAGTGQPTDEPGETATTQEN